MRFCFAHLGALGDAEADANFGQWVHTSNTLRWSHAPLNPYPHVFMANRDPAMPKQIGQPLYNSPLVSHNF